MKNTLKNNLVYLFNAVLGAFVFILFAFPYIAAFISSGGKETMTHTISGYRTMDLWDVDAWGVLSSLFQVFVLVVGILIMAWGVCGLLKGFRVFKAFPDTIGKLESKKLGEYALIAYAALNVLVLVFLVVFCIANTESVGILKGGFRPSGGMFVAPVISVGAYVAYKLLDKKLAK